MTLQEREFIRPLLETEIERLIAALDLLDADPDMEESCDDEGVADWDLEDNHDAEMEAAGTGNYIGPCSLSDKILGQRL